jgi:hypothetical protein
LVVVESWLSAGDHRAQARGKVRKFLVHAVFLWFPAGFPPQPDEYSTPDEPDGKAGVGGVQPGKQSRWPAPVQRPAGEFPMVFRLYKLRLIRMIRRLTFVAKGS